MRKQHGFIQGALLIGIALLAVVIGAFAMASNNNTTDTSKEKTKTNAAVAVKKFADAYEAYQIKAAQTDVATADTYLHGSYTFTMPAGISVNYNNQPDKNNTGLVAILHDAGMCAAINRILGLSASDSDQTAIDAGSQGSKQEACINSGENDYIYFRSVVGTYQALN